MLDTLVPDGLSRFGCAIANVVELAFECMFQTNYENAANMEPKRNTNGANKNPNGRSRETKGRTTEQRVHLNPLWHKPGGRHSTIYRIRRRGSQCIENKKAKD